MYHPCSTDRLQVVSRSCILRSLVLMQDTLCTAGLETTAGARVLRGYVPSHNATAVARLKAAGAVVLGKCNCDAFAMGSTTESSDYHVRLYICCPLSCRARWSRRNTRWQ